MTGLTNSPLPPGRNCRPFPDQLASRSADDGSAKSWLGKAKHLEARRHCHSQCEDRALTEGHERSSLFLRKFRPAHSHHNASASWHESGRHKNADVRHWFQTYTEAPAPRSHSCKVQARRDTKLAMSHNKIEIYWKTIETAPHGVIAQVRVTDGCGSDYSLPYPCKLTKDGWVNAASGKPLMVRATYWRAACRNHAEDEGRDVRPASEGASARAQLISQ